MHKIARFLSDGSNGVRAWIRIWDGIGWDGNLHCAIAMIGIGIRVDREIHSLTRRPLLGLEFGDRFFDINRDARLISIRLDRSIYWEWELK